MNKKGQFQPFFLLMIGVIIFIVSFALVGSMVNSSNISMTHLNCSDSSIGTVGKLNCTITDMIAPFFIALVIGLGGTALTAKLMGG